mmetsp:Transcript_15295/g.43104  ORF Transcript_15295/g.43104 Transcript_15295/m.43104 type:complete len:279 (+) Transcript_15295:161-997(+)|eukprot:CAMPEP_0119562160 /NCGR_PEP_ID=MMETSP1352-20130426/19604_1 /TAXON_ID=265584 /ORGANISM="Stauroneis constricta, Strain CCMP1120" /LENGTH=278 /DNA_ID=CAMNT_0007610507 /DNA_START=110 /DNA_END=949 /DNA_ORIENTATION=-
MIPPSNTHTDNHGQGNALELMNGSVQFLLQNDPARAKDVIIMALKEMREHLKAIEEGSMLHATDPDDSDNSSNVATPPLPSSQEQEQATAAGEEALLAGPHFQTIPLHDTPHHGREWFFVNKAIVYSSEQNGNAPFSSSTARWGTRTTHHILASLLANAALTFYTLSCRSDIIVAPGKREKLQAAAAQLYEKAILCIERDIHPSAIAIKSIAFNNLAYIQNSLGEEDHARVAFSKAHLALNSSATSTLSFLMDAEDLEGMSVNILVSKICRPTAARAA